MARFKYNGEPPRQMYPGGPGPTLKIRLPQKDGTVVEYTPVPPKTNFVVGDDIGYDITDSHALRILRADTRFTELT